MTKVEERGDYLYPMGGQFNITEDNILVKKGSHFFCQGHLSAVEVEKQSRNEKYCLDCLKSTREA